MTQLFLVAALGVLFSVGMYLVLRCDMVRVVWGTNTTSQSADVYLVTMGEFDGLASILSGHGAGRPTSSDPIVQALVLATIVIGFRTAALVLALTYWVYEGRGAIDVYELGGSRWTCLSSHRPSWRS